MPDAVLGRERRTRNEERGTGARGARASNHPDLGGVAPGAHDAAQAGGAHPHPDHGAGGEAGQDGLAVLEDPGGLPRGGVVRVAGGGLHLVGARGARGLEARRDRARELAVAQAQVRRGRRGCGVGRAARGVAGEAALLDDAGVAVGHGVDVVAQRAEVGLELGAGLVEGEDVGGGLAGAGDETGVVGRDQGLEGDQGEGQVRERRRVARDLVVDVLGDGAELGGAVAAEVDDCFRVHAFVCFGFRIGGEAVPREARRVPREAAVPLDCVCHFGGGERVGIGDG